MIAQLISFPISVILFIWMLRIKKNDPFPKGSVVKMLITGALCTFGSAIATILLALLVALVSMGPADLASLLSLLTNPSAEETASILERIQAASGQPTLLRTLVNVFLTAAIVEEVLKYLAMRLCLRRPGMVKTRMDAVVCAAIVGLAFQVIEDFSYAGSIATALVRAFTPFHFVFGVVMGYYYGKSLVTGSRTDGVKALLIPILIHGLYDFSLQCPSIDERYLIFSLVVMAFMLAFTIYMIVKLHKWSRDGTLAEPIIERTRNSAPKDA